MAHITKKNIIITIAKTISIVMNPMLILVLAILGLGSKHNLQINDLIFALPFFGAILCYIFIRIYFVKDGDFDLSKLKTRKYLGISALLGLTISYLFTHPVYPVLDYFFLKAGLVIFITGWISIYWKISFHAIGFSTFVFALYSEYSNPLIFLFFLLLPPMFWARIVLKKHSWKQLVAGTIAGALVLI